MPDTNRDADCKAYGGEEPYLFISYGQGNEKLVSGHLDYLRHQGYRFWYDEGINPGNERPEEISRSLRNAAGLLLFLSPQSIRSENVTQEINFALNLDKRIYPIYLAPTELPAGLKLQIGAIHALKPWGMTLANYGKAIRRMLPETVRDPKVTWDHNRLPPRVRLPVWRPPFSLPVSPGIWAAGILLLAILGTWLFRDGSDSSIPDAKIPSDPETPAPLPTAESRIEIPDLRWDMELRDFIEKTLVHGWDGSIGRMFYGDIVVAREAGAETTFWIGGFFTRDGQVCRIDVDADGRWTSKNFPSDAIPAKSTSREANGWHFRLPAFEIAKISDPKFRVEEVDGKARLVGSVYCKPLAEADLRDPKLQVLFQRRETESETGETSLTNFLRVEQVPAGVLHFEALLDREDLHNIRFDQGALIRIEAFALFGNPRNLRISNNLPAKVELVDLPPELMTTGTPLPPDSAAGATEITKTGQADIADGSSSLPAESSPEDSFRLESLRDSPSPAWDAVFGEPGLVLSGKETDSLTRVSYEKEVSFDHERFSVDVRFNANDAPVQCNLVFHQGEEPRSPDEITGLISKNLSVIATRREEEVAIWTVESKAARGQWLIYSESDDDRDLIRSARIVFPAAAR